MFTWPWPGCIQQNDPDLSWVNCVVISLSKWCLFEDWGKYVTFSGSRCDWLEVSGICGKCVEFVGNMWDLWEVCGKCGKYFRFCCVSALCSYYHLVYWLPNLDWHCLNLSLVCELLNDISNCQAISFYWKWEFNNPDNLSFNHQISITRRIFQT